MSVCPGNQKKTIPDMIEEAIKEHEAKFHSDNQRLSFGPCIHCCGTGYEDYPTNEISCRVHKPKKGWTQMDALMLQARWARQDVGKLRNQVDKLEDKLDDEKTDYRRWGR